MLFINTGTDMSQEQSYHMTGLLGGGGVDHLSRYGLKMSLVDETDKELGPGKPGKTMWTRT